MPTAAIIVAPCALPADIVAPHGLSGLACVPARGSLEAYLYLLVVPICERQGGGLVVYYGMEVAHTSTAGWLPSSSFKQALAPNANDDVITYVDYVPTGTDSGFRELR